MKKENEKVRERERGGGKSRREGERKSVRAAKIERSLIKLRLSAAAAFPFFMSLSMH